MLDISWMKDGVCQTVDPDVFYPRAAGTYTEARKACADCTVQGTCLDYALANMADEFDAGSFGMWGGKTESERRNILAGRRYVSRGLVAVA